MYVWDQTTSPLASGLRPAACGDGCSAESVGRSVLIESLFGAANPTSTRERVCVCVCVSAPPRSQWTAAAAAAATAARVRVATTFTRARSCSLVLAPETLYCAHEGRIDMSHTYGLRRADRDSSRVLFVYKMAV